MKPTPSKTPKPVNKNRHKSCVEKNGMHYHANEADYEFLSTGKAKVVRINKSNEKFDLRSATRLSR